MSTPTNFYFFIYFRDISDKKQDEVKNPEPTTESSATPNAPRNVKTKGPVIGESIKMVANQLLETHSNTSVETPIVPDTRIPPKLKNQLTKHKVNKRNEDTPVENSHAGIAVPITMEELETENKVSDNTNESSTSNEGISTWILLSNPNKDNVTSTEPTKAEESQKKQKPNASKNKAKRPPNNKVPANKRPIIGSTNKSDLVAGGSAINENVFNKIKDTVLSNVQKNKSTSQRTTTLTTTTAMPSTEALTTKKEVVTKAPSSVIPVIKVTSKPTKKKNKNKQKVSTTLAPIVNESALLPMEPKEQEIELEVSTPATTTKKPKRSSTKKKNKTKKRKTTKPKPETAVSDVKTSNKTKSTKTKKPTSLTGPITSQLYSYFSREVMPSVGVGMLGLASLVGIAGYFLYPFATPVRRTFEVDKKDDIYRHNAEEYGNEGNGQAEEEMLGTVLAGMPAHSKHKLNPYAGQTAHVNRYPAKKEQDLRYRHVATSYEPNYNVRYPQQKTGIAHGAVYSEPMNYNHQQHKVYDTRHVYATESKYLYDKGPIAYTPQPSIEPIYAAPQTAPQSGPSGISSYGNDASNSVVYGIKPSSDSDFKPVYPFEGQFYSETTNSPMTYPPPTSMYLGSNNESEDREDQKFDEESDENDGTVDNKFVVGNVPKELVETATPAVVPEHGPRHLRRKRNAVRPKRGIVQSIEELLKATKENKDIFISNEIDEPLENPIMNLAPMEESSPMKSDVTAMPEMKDIFPVYSMPIEPVTEEKSVVTTTEKTEIVESVSTLPIDGNKEKTTESETANELDTTTKAFKVYEVFPSETTTTESPNKDVTPKIETTTQFRNMNTETTTEIKSETTSTMPPSPSPILDPKVPVSTTSPSITTPKTTNSPEVLTYPPLNQGDGGFFTFLKRLIEFKYRLGLSILQTTSDNLNRYLRSMEGTVKKVAKGSRMSRS